MRSVNPSAHPRSSLRQEQAAVTRRRILEAARALFYRDGYAATTLKSVALDAGVAIQTVYAVFGSKAAILEALRWLVVDLPEADAAVRAAMQERTLEGRMGTFARSIRLRWELAGDIVRINEDAARADPAVRADSAAVRGRRQAGMAAFVAGVQADLLPAMDAVRTTAIVDALTMHDGYAQLVGVHGWSPDEYERWLAWELVHATAFASKATSPQDRPGRGRSGRQ